MLYINNIDDYSFNVGTSESENLQVYAKRFTARTTLPVGNATYGLVTIRSNDEHFNLVNLAKPEDLVINGIIFLTAEDAAIAFNSMMNNVLVTTTTTTVAPPVTTTTTTEAPATTTTTTEAPVTTTTTTTP